MNSGKVLKNRRQFIKIASKSLAGLAASSLLGGKPISAANISNKNISKNIIVLGIDGMDPNLLSRFIQKGEMPSFKKLMDTGYWSPLQTTTPPQSPVAWSSFISGTNPGGTGIFDFIHRDPKTFTPHLSTSRSYDSDKLLKLGDWQIPLKGGKVELLRRGPAFWTYLEEHGIPASLFKLPANFPVIPSSTRQISGMGTPDLLGSYGTFTFFTDIDIKNAGKFTGGRVVKVDIRDHVIKTFLEGPPNSLRKNSPNSIIHFTLYRDPWEDVVKIDIQEHKIILRQGEWSEWLPIKFEMMPLFASVGGMVRIFVQQVHPHLRLYMSPINIDPMEAHIPISSPHDYSKNLSEAIGRFYTQGFPEDTKALSNGIFSNEEFLVQSKMVLQERMKAFDYEFDQFNEGLFFFYFSSIDQNTHMMWKNMDPTHNLYDPKESTQVKEAVYYFYKSMDNVLQKALSKMEGNSTLMLLSDHGFAPFTREFHLSTWLVENGFTVLKDSKPNSNDEFYQNVDWPKTKAFAMGLNGIYINIEGRELNGSVLPRHVQQVKDDIIAKLTQVKDQIKGKNVVASAYDALKIYSGSFMHLAPDIIVGYQSGYRISDEAVLGSFPEGIIQDRQDKWSADHCMAPDFVPGVLMTNGNVIHKRPGLWDMAPTILKKFGLNVPREMEGQPILA